VPPFRADGGVAYVAVLEAEVPAGDSPEDQRKSMVGLFENEVLLGPAHAHHYAIRDQGHGRYSHWNNALYFSASDNTDPNSNGRSYALAIPSEGVIAPR
jgi:hypothetical protein